MNVTIDASNLMELVYLTSCNHRRTQNGAANKRNREVRRIHTPIVATNSILKIIKCLVLIAPKFNYHNDRQHVTGFDDHQQRLLFIAGEVPP